MTDSERSPNGGGRTPDLSHVKGQEAAKRALEVAAAGEHPILLIGPAGSGKTLLGRCLPGLLPLPTREEAAEIAETYRRAKLDPPPGRPFREPHFSTRPLDLVGRRRPGEVDLARGGVLVLDNLQAFGKRSVRALGEALEANGRREAGLDTRSAASFLLVAAMRPCPCGYLHDPRHDCSCAPWEVARYWRPIEELFLDLVHLHVEVPAIGLSELRSRAGEATREVAERVRAARERQLARPEQQTWNAFLRPWALPKWCRPDPAGQRLLDVAFERLGLSVRAVGTILRVARTIADLAGAEDIRAPHVAEAIQYRCLSRRRDPLQREHPGPLTPAEAQAVLSAIALDLLGIEDRCQQLLASLPRSPDEDAMIEGRIALDLPTELRATVECFLVDELRPAIESLERVSRVTDEDLGRDHLSQN